MKGPVNSLRGLVIHRQDGFTLIELLVALAISTVIALAAVSSLVISRQGFTAVDAASQLRDNARFAVDTIQRLGVQAGYKDVIYATTVRQSSVIGVASNPNPDVTGFNNAVVSATDPENAATARITADGSDILILRYQQSETFPGSGVSEGTMIDCLGASSTSTIAINRDDRVTSVLHVNSGATTIDGEPSLMCTRVGSANPTQPLIRGVENFQVLYGIDGGAGSALDFLADRFLRADQIIVTGDPIATNANWRRVRSIRIGMVLRGPPGSAINQTAQTFYPLGSGQDSATGAIGSAMSSANDTGTIFAPTPDGRLRQAVTFTVHLRNELGL